MGVSVMVGVEVRVGVWLGVSVGVRDEVGPELAGEIWAGVVGEFPPPWFPLPQAARLKHQINTTKERKAARMRFARLSGRLAGILWGDGKEAVMVNNAVVDDSKSIVSVLNAAIG